MGNDKNKFRKATSCHQSRKAMTRRDFIANTAGAAVSTLFLPGVTSLLSSIAQASCRPSGLSTGGTPFICVDLAGGGNIAGSNILVGGIQGQQQFLPSYTSLGISDARAPRSGSSDFVEKLNPSSKLLFHADSAFFEGITNELTPTARQKVDGAIFCTRSADDTNTNPTNPLFLIAKAHLQNRYKGELAVLVGTSSSDTGGNSATDPKYYDPSMRSVRLANPEDGQSFVDVGVLKNWIGDGRASGAVVRARAEKILNSINHLSSSQLSRFSSLDLSAQVKALVDCGYLNSKESVNKYLGEDRVKEVNPALDPLYQPIFALDPNANSAANTTTVNGITRSAGARSLLRQSSGVAKLVLEGKSNAGTVSFGGYDYHGGNRADTDERDRQSGHVVGALINMAESLGKDLFIYLFTDGGLASSNNLQTSTIAGVDIQKPQWASDNGTKGATCLLYYRHSGLLSVSRSQIGYYNSSASVERTGSNVSDNIPLLSQAILHNYLMATSDDPERDLRLILGTNPFSNEDHIAFRRS